MNMYRGQQEGSSHPTSDISGHSPADSIELSPTEMSRPMGMEHLMKSQFPFDVASVAGARPSNNIPEPYSLRNFYANDEGPWNGLKTVPQPGYGINSVENRRNHSAFSGWRSTGAPSDCGTQPLQYQPSDSGYESRAKQSVDDRSVYDENQDTQSLTGHVFDFNPFLTTPGFARDTPMQPWHTATPAPVQNVAAEKQLVCPDCHAPCKTRSELNKHSQRHRKAHKCDVEGCSRKEGFGTLNDLERHKTSCHPNLPSSVPRYKCNIGQCHTKDKIWPRADNFRQHLKRVHQRAVQPDDDLSGFIYQDQSQKPTEALRTIQEDLEGVGFDLFSYVSDPLADELNSSGEPMEDLDELVLDPNLTNVEGPHNMPTIQTEYVQPKEISRPASVLKPISMPRTELRGSRAVQPQITVDLTKSLETPPSPQELRKKYVADDMDYEFKASPSGDSSSSKTSQEEASSQGSSNSIDDIDETGALKLLEKFPHLFEKLMKAQSIAAPSTAEKPPPPPSTAAYHECPRQGCSKLFMRRCELKKHMKRHDKPYGCTFTGCAKKFGSKNDWKRHENSQHFQTEVWKCDERRTTAADEDATVSSSTATACGKVCNRRETFRSHLLKEHSVVDAQKVDKALDRCRIGRNHEARFWCGFCKKTVEVTKKGANAWVERFNHIDNHYTGRDGAGKRDISEWMNVDPELPEMDFTGSVDDSSDGESADEAAVAPRQTAMSSRKRSAEDVDDGGRGHKRSRPETRVMWTCCGCSRAVAPVKLHDACVDCSHRRCDDCEREEVTVH